MNKQLHTNTKIALQGQGLDVAKSYSLSFVIPVYNEEHRLDKTFAALKAVRLPVGFTLSEIIFVSDGSTDKTNLKIKDEKLKIEKKQNAKVTLISYKKNRGKGYAVKMGMLSSTADYTLFFDADMSTPLSEFSKLTPFIKNGYEVVVGTRKNGHSTVIKHQPLYREVLGKGFTLLTQLALNTWVTDFTCGFKVYSKEAKEAVWSRTVIERWGYDAEIIFLANKLGFKIAEKAVIWENDERTKVQLHKAIPQTLSELFRIRLNHSIKPLCTLLSLRGRSKATDAAISLRSPRS